MNKSVYVTFVNKKTEDFFEELKNGKFEDKKLYEFIEKAQIALKQNPKCGIKLPRTCWPKDYIQRYDVNNLWKYDLPNAWRLIYTIKEDEIKILSIVLEWLDHKEYERKFNY